MSYVKRKFIKHFNELTITHSSTPMTSEEARCLEKLRGSFQDVDLPAQPPGSSTPIKNVIFPEASYHTPENQKFVYKAPETERYQTCLYMVPENYEGTLRKKVPRENVVEVIVPEGVSDRPGLFELTKNETSKDFVFSPKIDKKKMRFDSKTLDDGEKIVLSKWKNQIKHVYEAGGRKSRNIELGEETVINLKKNLLFEDCEYPLSRPRKSCKKRKSTDEKLIPSSPLADKSLNDDNSLSRADIRRKLNYSSDASFEKENVDPVPMSPRPGFLRPKSPMFRGFTKPKLRKRIPHTLTSADSLGLENEQMDFSDVASGS